MLKQYYNSRNSLGFCWFGDYFTVAATKAREDCLQLTVLDLASNQRWRASWRSDAELLATDRE